MSKTTLRAFVLALAATAMVVVASTPSEAGRRGRNNAAIAAGIAGLATGVIIAGALSQRNRYYGPGYSGYYYYPAEPEVRYYRVRRAAPPAVVYYEEPRRVYRVERRVVRGGYEPWTDAWYDYCEARYRSFNPRTGTYRGYDGKNHFCN